MVCGRCEIEGLVVVVGARGCELSVWPRSFPFGALRFGLEVSESTATSLRVRPYSKAVREVGMHATTAFSRHAIHAGKC